MLFRLAGENKEVKWDPLARRVSYEIATQAVLGDLLDKDDMDFLYPHAVANQHAAFSLVRLILAFSTSLCINQYVDFTSSPASPPL